MSYFIWKGHYLPHFFRERTRSQTKKALHHYLDKEKSTECCDRIDMLDTNYCVHNPGYHTYYDTNSWEIRDPHRRPQARHKIDYLEHTRWILKNIWRRTHNLTWFDPNLAYIHRERTWERFINKLDTKRSNFPLDDTRAFAFPLNLRLDYKIIPSLYTLLPCSSLSWLFRAF